MDSDLANVNYPEAEKQWSAALKEAEGFGPQDPRLATTLNNLGEVYRAQAKYAKGEPALQAGAGDQGEGPGARASRRGPIADIAASTPIRPDVIH